VPPALLVTSGEACLTIPEQSVDLVILMVTLHHMPPPILEAVMKRAHACLQPGGFVLIKEHDISDEVVQTAVHWEHHLYHISECIASGIEVTSANISDYLQNKYIANYKSKAEMNRLLIDQGFQWLEDRTRVFDKEQRGHVDYQNATNLYWQKWRKPN
jgi:SAM-dependent methyltransferase